jgi:DNA-binding transcriptional MocR family regulator
MNLPPGGLQLWVELPDGCSSAALFDAALQEGIAIAPGWLFSNSARSDRFLRINCGWPYDEALDAALRRLGTLAGSSMGGG